MILGAFGASGPLFLLCVQSSCPQAGCAGFEPEMHGAELSGAVGHASMHVCACALWDGLVRCVCGDTSIWGGQDGGEGSLQEQRTSD